MFSDSETANFKQREQVSEKLHVRLGHGLFRKLVSCAVLGGTLNQGENFGRSAPFYFCLIMKKIFTLFLFSMITFNAIHAEITWTLFGGTLTISGTGDMEGAPWLSQRDEIKKVVIKDGVTNIGERAFYYCSGLTSLTIPNSVTSIGEYAFWQCSGLTSLTIPNSVTSIGEYAFYGCSCLTFLTIPNSVTSIGDGAFEVCSGLTSVTIPNSVTSIGGYAFSGTKWYDNQPDGLVYAGKVLYAYKGTMPSNTKINIKEGTTEIASGAFFGCYSLTSVTIPNSVTSIGSEAFYYCSGLTSLTIPNSVTSIGDLAFEVCSGLTSLTIPNSVTSIGEYAFYKCSGLTSVTITNSVTSIEVGAFSGCYGLTSITIPNSVTSIGDGAFEYCSGLTSVTIPNSVTSIRQYAFCGCSGLTAITIPNSVTSIGDGAFSECSALTSITCAANTPPSCVYNCFNYVNKSIPVYVPANSINAYKKADGWKDFTNIQAIVSYTLTDGAFYTNNSQINGRDISYTRTFNNTAWQALYIPFSLNFNDWKDNFEIAYINGVRQLDKNDDGIIDETIMDVIKIKNGSTSPNMPYLIKAKTTGEKTLSVSNATLYPAEENSVDCSTTIAKYTFTGTYNAIPSATMIANKYYAMGGGELIQSDGSNDLKPYRWYMKVESRNSSYNASNAAKTITINVIGDEEEEMTTGIRQLQITNDELPVYDLNGRQVNENNLKPGIYVKNGKKFVVK